MYFKYCLFTECLEGGWSLDDFSLNALDVVEDSGSQVVICVSLDDFSLDALDGLEYGRSQVVISVSPRHPNILHTLLST